MFFSHRPSAQQRENSLARLYMQYVSLVHIEIYEILQP